MEISLFLWKIFVSWVRTQRNLWRKKSLGCVSCRFSFRGGDGRYDAHWINNMESGCEGLLDTTHPSHLLRQPKETWRWWSSSTFQFSSQRDGHECWLWRLQCCVAPRRKTCMGYECDPNHCCKYTSNCLRSWSCWNHAWLVSASLLLLLLHHWNFFLHSRREITS